MLLLKVSRLAQPVGVLPAGTIVAVIGDTPTDVVSATVTDTV